MKSWHMRLAILAIMISTIGCDRVTKDLAVQRLIGAPARSYLCDAIRLEYVENKGAFLGVGSNLPGWARTILFTGGTAAMLAVVAVALVKRRMSGQVLIGLSLLWAGGASNLLDRVRTGSVVDFMNVGLGPVRTGVFNVADVAIMAGVALLVLGRRPFRFRGARHDAAHLKR